MSNAKIYDVAQMLSANLMAGLETTQTKAANDSDFSSVLSDANKKQSAVTENNINAKDVARSDSGRTSIDKASVKEIKSAENTKNTVDNPETKDKVAADVAKAADKVAEKIKDTFNIDDEELKSAMEVLGLSFQDLLDPTKLKDLLMQITGTPDSITLITDSSLYEDVKSVMGFATGEVQSIVADNAVTLEDLGKVISDDELMKKAFDELASAKEMQQATDMYSIVNGENVSDDSSVAGTLPQQEIDEETNEDNIVVSEGAAVKVDVTYDNRTNNLNAEVKDSDNENVSDVKATDLGETETFNNISKSETDSSKGRNEGFEHASKFAKSLNTEHEVSSQIGNYTETVTTQVNNLGEVVETVTRYSNIDANEIVSQVTESIKVNYSADTTTMEMQLHPASLGTVNMQFTSVGGVVTAHILVQDEAVKAAIESQLITLQESFEEQGHKVESVEVSVANYDLNKGQEQNNNNESNNQNGKNGIKGLARRRINLNDFSEDDDDSELSDEEKITRDMMERNGNTVDYTV